MSFILQRSRSIDLSEGENGFSATIRVPWGEKVLCKFIVDGRSTTVDDVLAEVDQGGNVNNVYYAPVKFQEVDDSPPESPVTPKMKPRKMAMIRPPPIVSEVEVVSAPMISLTRAPVSVGEQGESISGESNPRKRGRFIGKLKHLFSPEED